MGRSEMAIRPGSPHFEGRLQACGVHLPVPFGVGNPSNILKLKAALKQPHHLLRDGMQVQAEYVHFRAALAEADSNSKVLSALTRTFELGYTCRGQDLPFTRICGADPKLKKLSVAKSHHFDVERRCDVNGDNLFSRMEQVDPDGCKKLLDSIQPSKSRSEYLLPNFFLQGIGRRDKEETCQHHAIHNGLVGARAMHQLRKASGPKGTLFNDETYAITCTFFTGILSLYAAIPNDAPEPGPVASGLEHDRPQIQVRFTLINSYRLNGSLEEYREGMLALHNARVWAKSKRRDAFIEFANHIASLSSSQSGSSLARDGTPSSGEDRMIGIDESPAQTSHDIEMDPEMPLRSPSVSESSLVGGMSRGFGHLTVASHDTP